MCMSKVFPNKPSDSIYIGLTFIQKWKILAGGLARSRMEQMVERVMEFASNFRPSQCTPHDVVSMSFLSPFIRMCRAEITVLEFLLTRVCHGVLCLWMIVLVKVARCI
jgi:hypothetical protein